MLINFQLTKSLTSQHLLTTYIKTNSKHKRILLYVKTMQVSNYRTVSAVWNTYSSQTVLCWSFHHRHRDILVLLLLIIIIHSLGDKDTQLEWLNLAFWIITTSCSLLVFGASHRQWWCVVLFAQQRWWWIQLLIITMALLESCFFECVVCVI